MAQVINIIFFLSVALLPYLRCEEDLPAQLHAKCVAETGVSEDKIPNAMKGEFPEDDKFKCYLKCISMSVGAMLEDGSVIVNDEILKILPAENREAVREMVRVCNPRIESTEMCQRAFELHKCAYAVKPEKYILF